MQIIPYKPEHNTEVVEILRANTPDYFAPSEEAEFKNYLESEREDYFIVESNDDIVGAGGINYFLADKIARVSWDMIHPDYHGKGIGYQLTQYRIDILADHSAIDTVIVRTSQLVYAFYEKIGFELVNKQRDYWAKGYDLFEMRMPLC